MFLPYRENAYININKLENYLLSETHVIGKNKAKFFKKIGFNLLNIKQFETELLKFKDFEVSEVIENEYGKKYIISGEISNSNYKKFGIVTVWMLEFNDQKPYLVTSYPKKDV